MREPKYPSPMNPSRLRRVIFSSGSISPPIHQPANPPVDRSNCTFRANRLPRTSCNLHRQQPRHLLGVPDLTKPIPRNVASSLIKIRAPESVDGTSRVTFDRH